MEANVAKRDISDDNPLAGRIVREWELPPSYPFNIVSDKNMVARVVKRDNTDDDTPFERMTRAWELPPEYPFNLSLIHISEPTRPY